MTRVALALAAAALAAGCAEEQEQPEGATTADPVAEAPPVEPAPESSFVVPLEAPDGSAVGSATFGQVLDQARTRVALLVTAAEVREAAVHQGTCGDLGEVAYELEPVTNEASTTLVDASLETIEAELPLAVAARAEDGAVVACGDVVEPEQGPGG